MKKAFTLIELLIVILIIGVVYTLAIGNFQKVAQPQTRVTLATLKEYLKGFEYQKKVRFLCLDDCSSCDVFVDGKKQTELEGVFDNFIDDSIKTYRYSVLDGIVNMEYNPFFDADGIEQDVCFSFSVDKQGVSDQVVVEFNNKVYDYTPYFEKTKIYYSIEDFIEAKEKIYQEVMQ